MSWRAKVLRLLRVPPEPAPPPGAAPRIFRAAPNYFRLLLLRWGLLQLAAIAGLVFAFRGIAFISTTRIPQPALYLIWAGEVVAVATVAANTLLGWILVKFDFDLRWYMLSDRAIRIREGITTVREKTIALANIQNISVRQGPLQRMLGIADVEVRTAGGGGGSSSESAGQKHHTEPMHVAYFRGVADAEEIRDLLLDGVRRQRDAGLGDPDEETAGDDTDSAVAELLSEARKLRAAVT